MYRRPRTPLGWEPGFQRDGRHARLGGGGRAGTRFECICCPGGTGALPAGLAQSLGGLARLQDPHGCWRGPEGDATPLVVLAFLGAGYTHLSDGGEAPDPREPERTTSFGEVVKRALRRLTSTQAKPAAEDTLRDRAVVALALTRAHDGSRARFLDPATRRALERLVASLARPSTEPISPADAAWCALALESATISYATEARERLVAACTGAAAPDAATMLVRVLLAPGRDKEELNRIAERLVAGVAATNGAIDLEAWYFATLAFERYDGPSTGHAGARWKTWNAAVRRGLASIPAGVGDPIAASLHALATEAACRLPDAIGNGIE